MRHLARRKERGQAIVLAAVAMISIVGALALVIDMGMFLIVQRQFQAAADAGALAGAWYDPVCPAGAEECKSGTRPPGLSGGATTSTCVGWYPACDVAMANADQVKQMCGGAVPPPTISTGTPLNKPRNVNWIVVTVECDAGYSFGRILNLKTKHVSASAAAAIGNRAPNGDIETFTTTCPNPQCRIARLLQ